MPRPKGAINKRKRNQYRSFEAPAPHDRGFVRLPWGLLNHPNWMALNHISKILYIDMRRVAAGRKNYAYARSLARRLMAAETFSNARDQLCEAGFIIYNNAHCARDKRQTAQFSFSDQWHGLWHSVD